MPTINSTTNSSKPLKYIFVTGGVISGLGKGIATASMARLLKDHGYNISVIKVDMYLNLDAGTINPLEHGEVFVTSDGIECDQDLGNYERFLEQDLKRHNYMTMGQIYYSVITNERHFEYEGEDVEGHIHIPQEIIRRINETAEKDNADIIFIEVGGTIGEYQNIMFFETIRRLKQKKPDDVMVVHLVYLLKPSFLGELKSKPAQSSIYELYKLGLQPDFVICRANESIDAEKKDKIAFNAGVPKSSIISAPDVDTIYKVPLMFKKQELDKNILKKFGLKTKKDLPNEWENFVSNLTTLKGPVKIAIVGKYFNFGTSVLEDAYICVIEALKHSAWENDLNVEIQWFDVERFEDIAEEGLIKKELKSFDGIIVPQGWGSRGVEGKIKTVQYARENKIPYLGLCFGMQMAVIEFARNVAGLEDANSEEVNKNAKHKVVHIMPDQKEYLEKNEYGGTIRLGDWPCKLKKGTILEKAYKQHAKNTVQNGVVQERHRHRYEVNENYKKQLEKAGLVFCGTSPDGKLAEAIELPKEKHPFFVATQFHPEYKSRPLQPHPIFIEFIKASFKVAENPDNY